MSPSCSAAFFLHHAAGQGEKQHLGQTRSRLRICPKYCQFAKFLCGVTDCHVAPLLAMTCRRLARVRVCKYLSQQHPCTRPCTRESVSVFCMSLRTTALQPQKPYSLLPVIARSGAAAPRRGNPFLCGSTKRKATLRANPQPLANLP